jgi:hypothetical protein
MPTNRPLLKTARPRAILIIPELEHAKAAARYALCILAAPTNTIRTEVKNCQVHGVTANSEVINLPKADRNSDPCIVVGSRTLSVFHLDGEMIAIRR